MASKKFSGKLLKDLTNGYGQTLGAGQEVVAYRRKTFCHRTIWDGTWEYHYHSLDGKVLIRTPEFLIETP